MAATQLPVVGEISFRAAVRVWLRIGLLSFGGPAGQIALMHRELVEERRWISEARFLHALNYCMLLPGPEAQQLAIYIGWLLHRTWGGVVAGALFVLPGALTVFLLSALYARYQQLPLIAALFFGVKAAVLAVVAEAVLRVGRRALKGRFFYCIAAAAFVAIFVFDVPFPLIVLAAGVAGVSAFRIAPQWFPTSGANSGSAADAHSVVDRMFADGELTHTRPSSARALRVLCIWLPLWFAPIVLLALWMGAHSVFVQQGLFFSKAAVVTFGGAYSVLAYVAQRAVTDFGWLRPGEMLDGLALAETTPGPLILVLQFVAYLGAYRAHTGLPAGVAGLLGAAIAVWVTFAPCFLWIFLGAPYIEALRNLRWLNAALGAITACVVGVILNLSIWLSLHVLFGQLTPWHWGGMHLLVPNLRTLNIPALVLAVGALVAMLRFHVRMPMTLGVCALLGFVVTLV